MSLLITLLSGGGGGGGGSGSVSGIILTPVVAATTTARNATYANGSSGVGATLTNGLTNLTAARVATTGALTVTYSNGTLGVGATLTNAGAQAALSIDSVALSVNDRVLVKNQAAAAQNGVYSVTNIGSGSTNWVMTRVTDFDQAAEMLAGTEIGVTAGTTNAGTLWLLSTTVSVVGTDAVTWGATAAFTIDGQSPTVGQRVLIKDQTTAAQNGIYTVTTVGSATALWVLTRTTDFDQAAEMLAGSMVEVVNGTVNAGTVWTLTTTVVTVGSNSVTFSSINISTKVDQNGTPIYAADTGAADAYVITLSPAPAAYTTGMVIRFKASAANATTTPTINVNGLGAKTIVKIVNTVLAANDILANQFVSLIYDGTNFVISSALGNAPTSGTVTNVATGTGLRGGPITGSGTVNFATQTAMSHRLTLTSATPVTTGDVSAATTLYLTPYKGTDIDVYSGSIWVRFQQVELSITNNSLSASKPYDVFLDYNSGTPQLVLTVWTNTTTRATALAYQDGILVKSGTTTSRYIGTIYTDAASKFNDAVGNRNVWNYYNRVARSMSSVTADVSWTYATNTWRQANANAANQLNWIVGVVEDLVNVSLNAAATNNSNATFGISIGLNTTSAATGNYTLVQPDYASLTYLQMTANLQSLPAVGLNFASWNEIVTVASGTITFYGTTVGQTGLIGSVWG